MTFLESFADPGGVGGAPVATPPERLADVLVRLAALRVANNARIEATPMSMASKANARGVVLRSHAYAARLCPQIFAAFGNSGGGARH